VLLMNPLMEEITGIRADKAVGDEMMNVARDAAFASFIDDVVGRVMSGGAAISEDFEFSGTSYKVDGQGLGSQGSFKAVLLMATKPG